MFTLEVGRTHLNYMERIYSAIDSYFYPYLLNFLKSAGIKSFIVQFMD